MSAKMAANEIQTHACTNQGHSWPVYMIKTKMFFWRIGFYLANQNNLKFSKSLDWLKKAGFAKMPYFCFHHVNRLTLARDRGNP